MDINTRKRYEIIKSGINSFGDRPFTFVDLFMVCEYASKEHGISIGAQDIVIVLMELYDDFKLDRKILDDGKVCFVKSDSRNPMTNMGSR